MAATLVALSGYSGCGKDTAAECLIDDGWTRRSIIEGLRTLLIDSNPWLPDGSRWADRFYEIGYRAAKDQIPAFTEVMVDVGQALRRVFGPMVWADQMLDSILPDERTVITDCRMPEEADAIRQRGGWVLRISRPGVGPALGLDGEPLRTDVALDGYPFDALLVNDGTPYQLGDKVKRVIAAWSG